jgi:hypothetical protein
VIEIHDKDHGARAKAIETGMHHLRPTVKRVVEVASFRELPKDITLVVCHVE